MQRLILIDGHAILHRAYHALPPLTSKDGMIINAVYGFTTMLLRILEDHKPTHLAVAFDLPAPTFRSQAYTGYQARRPEMESNLSKQIPLVHEMLAALKIPYFETAGYEADDMIGSLAKQAAEVKSEKLKAKSDKNLETIIITGDRDMLQLLNTSTKVCFPVKGLSEYKTYDSKLMEEEFGVTPAQWIDVKALKGDASDNYPGVAGIGPKTAEKLIKEYGTLENLYSNLDKLELKLKLKLAEGAEAARLGKKLATIVTDAPIKLDLKKMEVAKIDWEKGVEYMKSKLGFRTIVERIEKMYLNKKSTPPSHEARADTGGQMSLL